MLSSPWRAASSLFSCARATSSSWSVIELKNSRIALHYDAPRACSGMPLLRSPAFFRMREAIRTGVAAPPSPRSG
jgi:hypothetical protein